LDKFDEAYFKVEKDKNGKSTEEEFFGEAEKVPALPAPTERSASPVFYTFRDANITIIEGDF